MRRQIIAAGGYTLEVYRGGIADGRTVQVRSPSYQYLSSVRAGWTYWIMRQFGDKELQFIAFYNRQLTDEDRGAIDAFPEAIVLALP